MKKKKHFYHGRIRLLTMSFLFAIAALLTSSIVTSGTTAKEKMEQLAKTIGGGAAIALTPFALVGKMKTKGVWDNLDESTKTYVQSLESELNAAFGEVQKGILTEDELKAKHTEWMKSFGEVGLSKEQKEQLTGMIKTVQDQAILIQQMKDQGISGEASSRFSIVKQLTDGAEKLKAFRERKAGKFQMEMKSGADQAPTDIATHTIGLRVPGIGQIPTRKPFMRDLFTTVNCNLEYIKYIDQETVVRDAKNVATAAASVHTSKLTWKERSIQITNVRDLVDVPINMLDDYDFVEGELKNMLDVNVQLKVDNGLFLGTGVHPELHSIAEVSSEFNAANTLGGTITPYTASIQDPNIFDLVIAMASQIIALGQDGQFMPNYVLFNTIDRYKALLIKDLNNNYLMPPFVVRVGGKEYNIDGMQVRSNPVVPANSVWVGDSTKGTIYQRKTAIAEMSYENATNFEVEVVTLKVYERLNLLIRNVNANAFMKCTDVTTALAAIAQP